MRIINQEWNSDSIVINVRMELWEFIHFLDNGKFKSTDRLKRWMRTDLQQEVMATQLIYCSFIRSNFMTGVAKYSNSFSFAIESDDDVVQEVVQAFESRIKIFKPRTIKHTSDRVFYTAGVMRLVLNTNLLYGISDGEIRIERKEQTLLVHFVIRFYELIAISMILAVGALVIMDSILAKLVGLLLVVGVSYGVNVFITIVRYRKFVKRTMEDWLSQKKTIIINQVEKEWNQDKNKCDACGYSISDTDLECPDCGLRLQ